MAHCSARIGDAYFRTPRLTIKAFLDFLAILEYNPGADWRQLLGDVGVGSDQDPALTLAGDAGASDLDDTTNDSDLREPTSTDGDDDDLGTFRI